jgi:hypothetical protein
MKVLGKIRGGVNSRFATRRQKLCFEDLPPRIIPPARGTALLAPKNLDLPAAIFQHPFAIAPSSRLDNRFQGGHLAKDDREIDVDAGFNQLCADQEHRLLGRKPALHGRKNLQPVRGTHRCREMKHVARLSNKLGEQFFRSSLGIHHTQSRRCREYSPGCVLP